MPRAGSLEVPGILLCLLFYTSKAAVIWHGITESGWRGCVLPVILEEGTILDVSGVVTFGEVGSRAKLERNDQGPMLSLVGVLHVGLEFGGDEKPSNVDCAALLNDQGATITGVSILNEGTGEYSRPKPLHLTPDPATAQVSTGMATNLAKVGFSKRLAALL